MAAKDQITWETIGRAILGCLAALLIWTGNALCDRVDRLESNQIRIMVHLGVSPEYTHSEGPVGLLSPVCAEPWESNQPESQKTPPKSP